MSSDQKGKSQSRRSFIKNTSIVAGSFFIVPRHVLGRGFIAPSDKLNIAGIGCGGKAEVNLPYAFNNGAENIAALCDVDDRMAVKARKMWPNAPYYRDYRELLEQRKEYRRSYCNYARPHACCNVIGRNATGKACVL